MNGSITCFSVSMDDDWKVRSSQTRDYIKNLPAADIVPSNREDVCEQTAARFGYPDIPEFPSGELERDDVTISEGDASVAVTVYFPYNGDPMLLTLFHRQRPGSPGPPAFRVENGFLIKTYNVAKEKIDTIDRLVEADVATVQEYMTHIRNIAPQFNETLADVARQAFDQRVRELNENELAAATLSASTIRVRRRTDGLAEIITPAKRKPLELKTIERTPSPHTDLIREYMLEMAAYDDILKTISSMVSVVERSPATFAKMGEEDLRTILLVGLNGLYEGQASGETFNGRGKTDILIRREDRNVFIAECLMWQGREYLLKKINEQLFQYAMWRDSKLALIVFNRHGDLSRNVDTMKATLEGHPQCVKPLDWTHATGARYQFRRHDDSSRLFVVSALAFDVPSD